MRMYSRRFPRRGFFGTIGLIALTATIVWVYVDGRGSSPAVSPHVTQEQSLER
jgi:hypothetical protein